MHHTKEDLKAAAEAQYSKNLRRTIGRIKKILKRRGIAGSVIIYEPGFSEYLAMIDPIYSAVQFGEKPGELKILDSLEHYGDEATRKERLEATMNMLLHLANMSRLMFQNFNNMAHQVEKRAKVYGDKTSHEAGLQDQEGAEKPLTIQETQEKASPTGRTCVEPGCGLPAVADFNGYGAWGCQEHLDQWNRNNPDNE